MQRGSDHSELRALATQSVAEISALRQHISYLEASIHNATTATATAAKTSADELPHRSGEQNFKAEHQAQEQKVAELEADLEAKNTQLQGLRNKLELAAKKFRILLPQQKELAAKYAQCRSELQEAKTRTEKSAAEHSEKLRQTEHEKHEAQDAAERALAEKASLLADIAQVRAEAEEREKNLTEEHAQVQLELELSQNSLLETEAATQKLLDQQLAEQNTILRARSDLEEQSAALAAAESKRQQLEKSLNRHEQERVASVAGLQQELDEARAKLAAQEEWGEKLHLQIAAQFEADAANVQREAELQEAELVQKLHELSDRAEAAEAAAAANAKFAAEATDAAAQGTQVQEELQQAMKTEANSAKQEAAEREKKMAEERKQLQDEIADARARYQDAASQLATEQSRCNALTEEVRNAAERNEAEQSSLRTSMMDEQEAFASKLNLIKADLELARKELSEREAAVQERLSTFEQEVSAATSERLALQEELDRRNAEFHATSSEVNETVTAELVDAQAKVTSAETEIHRLSMELQSVLAEQGKVKESLEQTLRTQYENELSSVREASQEQQTAQTTAASIALQEAIASATSAAREDAARTLAEVEREHQAALETARIALEQSVQATSEETQALREELQTAIADRADYQQKILKHEEQLVSTGSDRQQVLLELQNVQEQCAQAQRQSEELATENAAFAETVQKLEEESISDREKARVVLEERTHLKGLVLQLESKVSDAAMELENTEAKVKDREASLEARNYELSGALEVNAEAAKHELDALGLERDVLKDELAEAKCTMKTATEAAKNLNALESQRAVAELSAAKSALVEAERQKKHSEQLLAEAIASRNSAMANTKEVQQELERVLAAEAAAAAKQHRTQELLNERELTHQDALGALQRDLEERRCATEDALNAKVNSLREEALLSQQACDAAKVQLREATEEMRDARAAEESLHAKEVEELKAELGTVKEQVEELQSNAEGKGQPLSQVDARSEGSRSTNDADVLAPKTVGRDSAKVLNSEPDYDAAPAALLKAEQRASSAEAEARALSEQLHSVEASAASAAAAAKDKYDAVLGKLRATFDMSVALKAKNEALQKEKLAGAAAGVGSTGVSGNVDVAKVLEDHAALEKENEKLEEALEDLQHKVDEATTELAAEKHRCTQLLARAEAAEDSVASRQGSEIEKLEVEKRDLLAELGHMATALKRERAKAIEIDKLRRSFLSMQQQQDDRLSEIKRTDLAIIQEVRNTSANDSMALREKLASEETKVRLLAKKLKQVAKAQKERDAQISSLEAQLNDSTRLVAIGKTQIAKLSSLLAQTNMQ